MALQANHGKEGARGKEGESKKCKNQELEEAMCNHTRLHSFGIMIQHRRPAFAAAVTQIRDPAGDRRTGVDAGEVVVVAAVVLHVGQVA